MVQIFVIYYILCIQSYDSCENTVESHAGDRGVRSCISILSYLDPSGSQVHFCQEFMVRV